MTVPNSSLPATTTLGADTRSMLALRSSAARDPKTVIKEASKQFEALFMQQLMKSMRESTMASGMLENSGTKLGTEMLDTQFATQMSGLPGGLGQIIQRQLERQTSTLPAPAVAAAAAAGSVEPSGNWHGATKVSQRQADFLRSHSEAAKQAEAETGIPAAFMVAQAAHESGWGRHEIRNADGSSSHNVFAIKAGAGWTGPVAEVSTTEYIRGVAQKVVAKFRAYASDAESFQDYARMLKESPRYARVVAQVSASASTSLASAQAFAHGLQRAGYATDPAYADKLSRVINTTLRAQRLMA